MSRRHYSNLRPAFTLVELMISIALALILIIGINAVFKIASETVGAGQSLGTISRDDRTAHTTIYNDLHNAVTNLPRSNILQSPAFFIASSQGYAFRNAVDRQGDADGDPSTLNNVAMPVDAVTVSDRSHRKDTLGFFASGDTYARQTADDGQYVSPTSSSEAYIWYGHLMQPNNAFRLNRAGPNSGFYGPGDLDVSATNKNDNNALACDWILGRWAMLLTPNPPAGDYYIGTPIPGGNPLAWNAVSSDHHALIESRYDIVNTSLSAFAQLETSLPPAPPLPQPAPAMSAQVYFRDQMIWINSPNPINPLIAPIPLPGQMRYYCNPFPGKPLNSATMAATAPIFLRSCSQFIVEFAGDYINQNPDGSVIPGSTGGDGIDYIVDTSVPVAAGQTPPHKIRWYGFPRSVNGDGSVHTGPNFQDVVPVRDLRGIVSAFERVVPLQPAANANYTGTAYAGGQYVCSWGTESPDALPKMIRITFALDDPNGRVAAPQFFEYVIDLTQ